MVAGATPGGIARRTSGASDLARSNALERPRRGRVLAGVCLALARRFDMKPWQVRMLFVLSCLLPGPQILLYLALWVILPSA
jgi:phage shock protein PspC (stress-responsive transcriptional regulator)